MALMKVTILIPLEGSEKQVENLLQGLDGIYSMEEGYVLGLRFGGRDGNREIGRIFVWESVEVAERAEGSPEASTIRQRLGELVQDRSLECDYELYGYALRPR